MVELTVPENTGTNASWLDNPLSLIFSQSFQDSQCGADHMK